MDEKEKIFNGIVEEYSERLYWHVRRFVHSHEDTDDLLQEIFIKIWKALPSFRGESELFTWVYRIATNEAINFLRRRKVRAVLNFTSLAKELERKIDEDPWFNGTEAEAALDKAVAALPEKQRAVFIMRYYEELPYARIAEITGTSTGALKASYHIACEKIKAALNL